MTNEKVKMKYSIAVRDKLKNVQSQASERYMMGRNVKRILLSLCLLGHFKIALSFWQKCGMDNLDWMHEEIEIFLGASNYLIQKLKSHCSAEINLGPVLPLNLLWTIIFTKTINYRHYMKGKTNDSLVKVRRILSSPLYYFMSNFISCHLSSQIHETIQIVDLSLACRKNLGMT